jgi:hypothetical protein
MATIAMTDIPYILKTKFTGRVVSSVYKNLMLLNQIKFSNADIDRGARTVNHSARLTRNNGTGFRSTSGARPTLPTASGSQGGQPTVEVKSLYGYCEFDGPAIRATLNDAGSFTRLVQDELIELSDSMSIEMNRAAYGWGAGQLGTVDTLVGAASNYVNLYDTYANPLPNIEYFDEGQYIDFFTSAGVDHGEYKITQVDRANKRLYFSTDPVAGGVVQGDIAYIAGNRNAEPMGLMGFGDDGTYVANLHGVANTFSRWNGYVDDNTTLAALRAFDETKLRQLIAWISRSGKKNILLTTSQNILTKIGTTVKSTMLQPAAEVLKGGFMAVAYMNVPIYDDVYHPEYHIFGANLDYLKGQQLFPGGAFGAISFLDLDGTELHRVYGQDAYYVDAVADYELSTARRNAFGRYSDIDWTL